MFILWMIFACVVAAIIGGLFGTIFGKIAVAIDELFELIPIPVQITRIVMAFGTSYLVYHFCEKRLYFGLTVAWWLFFLFCTFGGDEADPL